MAEEISHMNGGKKNGQYRSGLLKLIGEILKSPKVEKLEAKISSDLAKLMEKIKELFGKGFGDGDEGSGSGDKEATDPKNETTPGGDVDTTTPTPTTTVTHICPGGTCPGPPPHPDNTTLSTTTPGGGDQEPTATKNGSQQMKSPDPEGSATAKDDGKESVTEVVPENARAEKNDLEESDGNKGEGDKSVSSFRQGVREGEWNNRNKGQIG